MRTAKQKIAHVALIAVAAVALLVPLAAYAGFAGTDLFIPFVGRGPGVYPSNWFTTVWVYNPNGSTVTVTITFLERQKNNVSATPPSQDYQIGAGETLMVENIVEDVFLLQKYGALRIECDQKVVATSRTFSKESAASPLNQSVKNSIA